MTTLICNLFVWRTESLIHHYLRKIHINLSFGITRAISFWIGEYKFKFSLLHILNDMMSPLIHHLIVNQSESKVLYLFNTGSLNFNLK